MIKSELEIEVKRGSGDAAGRHSQIRGAQHQLIGQRGNGLAVIVRTVFYSQFMRAVAVLLDVQGID